MLPLIQWMNNNPGVNLTVDNFQHYEPLFDRLGFSFEDMVNELNSYVALAKQENSSDVISTGQLLNRMEMYQYILVVSAFTHCAIRYDWLTHWQLCRFMRQVLPMDPCYRQK